MLTIHHLSVSQSERIVWLCEELGLPYELVRYRRESDTGLAPPEYKALHPFGTAPVIADGDLVLGESGAIVYSVLRYKPQRSRYCHHPSTKISGPPTSLGAIVRRSPCAWSDGSTNWDAKFNWSHRPHDERSGMKTKE